LLLFGGFYKKIIQPKSAFVKALIVKGRFYQGFYEKSRKAKKKSVDFVEIKI